MSGCGINANFLYGDKKVVRCSLVWRGASSLYSGSRARARLFLGQIRVYTYSSVKGLYHVDFGHDGNRSEFTKMPTKLNHLKVTKVLHHRKARGIIHTGPVRCTIKSS